MAKYLLKRVLQAIGVVFCISLITFFVLNIVPGNPVEIMLGEFADQATIARVTHEMGLDQPIYIQYFSWLGNMLQGNFGTSYFQNKPVIDILTSSFLVTAKLAGIAYILAVALGVVVGVVAGGNHNSAGNAHGSDRKRNHGDGRRLSEEINIHTVIGKFMRHDFCVFF